MLNYLTSLSIHSAYVGVLASELKLVNAFSLHLAYGDWGCFADGVFIFKTLVKQHRMFDGLPFEVGHAIIVLHRALWKLIQICSFGLMFL